jgi:16S rRNA (cytosine967-C5)-methyltransferase
MAADGLAARGAAVALLDAVLGERRMMADVLADPAGPLAGLAPGDRGRAQRLALTVLRHLEQADRVLAPHVRRAPPRTVQNVLRLGVVELAVEGAAAHGVVNAAVDLVRRGRKTGHSAGLVNAVLRKLAEVPDPFAGLPPQKLPMWLRQPLVHAWGREAVTGMEAVQALPPPLDITLRDGAEAPEGAVLLPTGSLRLSEAGQVSALRGYAAGGWWVQDAAAALPVRVLDPRPGERVLDMCAAPGGKTLQLAAAGAEVTALDMSGPRLARLRENLARTKLWAEVVQGDATRWRGPAPFDAVLLDAPCSATGVIRRHPDIKLLRRAEDLGPLAELQRRILAVAFALLAPGGRLVYATCSLLPQENEAPVLELLAREPRARRLPWPDGVELPPGAHRLEAGVQMLPGAAAGTDGFYYACLGRGSI